MSASLEQYVASSRAALTLAGLSRCEEDGRVWWRGGCGVKTMVLLHGVNDQAGTWAPVVPELSSRARLLIPDLAGHGESEPGDGPLEMTRILRDLHSIVEAENATQVVLAGNSMGGWVSMLYALERPERIEHLLLENASGMSWPVGVPMLARTREDSVAIFTAVHGPAALATEDALDAILSRAFDSPMTRVMQGGIDAYLLDSRLGELDLPVTLVWGRHDGLLPVAYGEALRDRIRGATLQVIEDAAHIPHRQQPERFLECLSSIF